MRKLALVICASSAIGLSICSVLSSNLKKNEIIIENQSSPSSCNITYTVKDFNDTIAVFETDNDTPIKITDVYVKDLPIEDQILLKNGIVVNNKSELTRLLEDYCS